MADGEDDMQLPRLGDIAQELPELDDENGFEPVSPGIVYWLSSVVSLSRIKMFFDQLWFSAQVSIANVRLDL